VQKSDDAGIATFFGGLLFVVMIGAPQFACNAEFLKPSIEQRKVFVLLIQGTYVLYIGAYQMGKVGECIALLYVYNCSQSFWIRRN